MKKSLLSLAVLAAFSGAAFAQSSVTVYGVVDMGFAHEDNGVAKTNKLEQGNQSGSRLGFRGTEDLGGGLSAVFALETGILVDTGGFAQGGTAFGRQSYVGLNGSFGSVKLGRQYTPIHIALDTIDPFGTGITGGGSGINSLFDPHGVRMNNTVNYSITTGPVAFQAAYGFGEVAGNNSAGRKFGASGTYANGPITGVLAYANDKNAAGTDSAKTTMLGGTYNFGPATLHGAYAWNKGVATLDTRDAMIGVTVPVGAGAILVDYLRKTDKADATGNSDSAQAAVGYTYSLSKRTNMYTSYSRNTNDSAVARNAGGLGLTDTLLNVGIRHKF